VRRAAAVDRGATGRARSRCCGSTGVRGGYGGSVVLEGLDLVVHEGEAVALLGRNGVGKTTTLRAITGTVAQKRRPDRHRRQGHHPREHL
jgi:branched-chain amino acid transport system ATP-binding protein